MTAASTLESGKNDTDKVKPNSLSGNLGKVLPPEILHPKLVMGIVRAPLFTLVWNPVANYY